MILTGYLINKEIHRGNRRIYYAGTREEDGLPVIIKTHFPGSSPSPNLSLSPNSSLSCDQLQLQHEYELLKKMNVQGLPKPYSMEASPNGLAIIFEHMDGQALSTYIKEKKIEDYALLLDLAIKITEILNQLHRHQIIHKDLQPENIFLHTPSKQVWISDFRFATTLPKETPVISRVDMMDGSISYMSPEQTGRMNRPLDYRTDFYSLGVTFYQLLTGTLPFESSDNLEIMHGHLAVMPMPPHEIDSTIP